MADEDKNDVGNDSQVDTSTDNADKVDADDKGTDNQDIDPTLSVEAENDLISKQLKEKEEGGEKDEPDGPSDEILETISGLMKGEGDKDKTKDDKDKDDKQTDDVNIPEEFSNAALALGWSEDDIRKFVADGNDGKGYSDDELKEMTPYLKVEADDDEDDKDKDTKKKDTADKQTDDKTKDGDDKDKDDKQTDDRDSELKALRERIATLEKAQEKDNETREKDKVKAMSDEAESFLDKASETFEIFGKGKELPKFPDRRLIPTTPQYKARAEVLGYALSFRTAGQPWGSALENALACYKGKHLEKAVERKVISRIKKDAKNLSPKRYGKNTKKTYVDETERQADVVRQAAKDAGSNKFD